MRTLCRVIQWGITDFTTEHALVMCAFLSDLFDSADWEEHENLHELIGWEDEDYTHAKDTPLDFLRVLLNGLNRLNYQFRCRIFSLLRRKYAAEEVEDSVNEELDAAVRSHLNCTHALVAIGGSVLKRCKATPVTETIGSLIVTGLVFSSIDPLSKSGLYPDLYLDGDIESHYIGNIQGYSQTVIDATRYSQVITQASHLSQRRLEQFKELCEINPNHKIEDDETVQSLFLSPPSFGIQTVVRGLYLRQLVESHE